MMSRREIHRAPYLRVVVAGGAAPSVPSVKPVPSVRAVPSVQAVPSVPSAKALYDQQRVEAHD